MHTRKGIGGSNPSLSANYGKLAGVIQWQNRSFPSFLRGFDSHRPLHMISFVRRKFNSLLVVASLTMSVNYIVMLSGSVIVGNLVGADGLAALNVCTPVFGGASFLASLLSVGAALVFSRAMGAFDVQRAAGLFSQTIVLAFLLGGGIYLAMRLGGSALLEFSGVTGVIRDQASRYWQFQSFALALTPAVLVMEALVFADGDGLVAAAAGAVHVLGSIGLSVLFTHRLGDASGVALGTALTMGLVLGVTMLHALRSSNHLRPVCYFSWADLKETLAASLADSTIYLCWGVLVLVINAFAVARFGQESLALVALAASVVEFSIVFDGVGEALIPLGGMYAGERNYPALRELARHSAVMAMSEGVVCGVLFFLFAPTLSGWYGIRGDAAALLPEATALIRRLACAMPFMGLLMMVNTHFLVVRHIPLAVSVTVVKDFVCPTVGALALGSLLGLRGLWLGFAFGYVIAAAYPFVVVRLRYGRELFPWLLPPDDGKMTNVTREGGEVFTDLSVPGRRRVIVRDTGVPHDASADPWPEGAISVKYLYALGCNRTEYVYEEKNS